MFYYYFLLFFIIFCIYFYKILIYKPIHKLFLKGKNMEKFIIEKEVGTIYGCKLVLKIETDFTNSDDAILSLNSADFALNKLFKIICENTKNA